MPQIDPLLIEFVRDSSRKMVRELGFMETGLAESGLPPSAVHALIEIGASGALTASALGERLYLEKSSISRMLRKLVRHGDVEERPNPQDARSKLVVLTAQGRDRLAAIDNFARRQVADALRQLSADEQRIVAEGLAVYSKALRRARTVEPG
jgi:DNA-binding MarR family transcriptional regulator